MPCAFSGSEVEEETGSGPESGDDMVRDFRYCQGRFTTQDKGIVLSNEVDGQGKIVR